MKLRMPDGQLIDTTVHDCARFKSTPCVFCAINAEIAPTGRYAVPFDVPGIYEPGGPPNVVILRLPADGEEG